MNVNFSSLEETEENLRSLELVETRSYFIVWNIQHPTPVFIVDLPGCSDRIEVEYSNQLVRAYLNPPESTIVHVVRGDIDPDTDPGAKYLTPFLNIPNKMLMVLTHTDLWLGDHDKIQLKVCKK